MYQEKRTIRNDVCHFSRFYISAIIIILSFAGYFRFSNLNWDSYYLLNPDERFLVQIIQKISLPDSLTIYFNPQISPLNPLNRGNSFFVYGTFPLLIVKSFQKLFNISNTPQNIVLLGRILSASCDFISLILTIFISKKIWKNWLSASITSVSGAFCICAIQQSHFFTVDNFSLLFSSLFLFFFIIAEEDHQKLHWSDIFYFFMCGLFAGISGACKISSFFFLIIPLIFLFISIFEKKSIYLSTFIYNILFIFIIYITALFSFRVFQPYSFSSQDFLNFQISENWLNNIKELAAQSSGQVPFPPAWQWSECPFYYSIQNLFIFGIGIPLSLIFVWGYIQSIIISIKNKRGMLACIIFSIFFFYIFQIFQFSKMMRYFLPIFPLLYILAGSISYPILLADEHPRIRILLFSMIGILGFLSFLWALSFSQIYRSSQTRIKASEWIYKNIPPAISLLIKNNSQNNEISLSSADSVIITEKSSEVLFPFSIIHGDQIRSIDIEKAEVLKGKSCILQSKICFDYGCKNYSFGSLPINLDFQANQPIKFIFPQGVENLNNNTHTAWGSLSVSGENCSIRISGEIGAYLLHDQIPHYSAIYGPYAPISKSIPYENTFFSDFSGNIDQIHFPKFLLLHNKDTELNLTLTIKNLNTGTSCNQLMVSSAAENDSIKPVDSLFKSENPCFIEKDNSYQLQLSPINNDVSFAALNQIIYNESTWDDALPLPMNNTLPYDITYGRYGSIKYLDLFHDEDYLFREKLIERTSAADYIIVSSNRIYGSAARIKNRFPILSVWYQQITDCDISKSTTECFNKLAQKKKNRGNYFDLLSSFSSEFYLGEITSGQTAEEAFTVYDHPTVFIFKKSTNFDLTEFRKRLNSVNVSDISYKNPVEYKIMKNVLDLMSTSQSVIQQNGGTWSELFNRSSILNHSQIVCILFWLLMFWFIGIITFPSTHYIFKNLRDKGYGISKFFGLIICGYFVWLSASIGAEYSRKTILIVLLLFTVFNTIIFFVQKEKIITDIKSSWKEMLQSEIAFVLCFTFFLLIRLGNPDLWHPYKGGEKPMDFSYFNAVLKSTTFPPYDPWFESGYLNYYYYGFYLSGLLVKLSGIIPSIAYNLILPTWYAFLGVGAFCVGSSLISYTGKSQKQSTISGAISIFAVEVIGNLGTLKVINDNLLKLGAAGLKIDNASFINKLTWFFNGIGQLFAGKHFSMYQGDWYWIPSRAIPGSAITEFPFFTFLYGDPHAHLFALPVTMLVLAWLITILREIDLKIEQCFLEKSLIWLTGAILLGTLLPTNTWDFPTYALLSIIVLIITGISQPITIKSNNKTIIKIIFTVISIAIVCGGAYLLFYPYFLHNFHETSLEINTDELTPIWSYLMHWGMFLFAIISWFIIETITWLSQIKLVDFVDWIKKHKIVLILCAGLEAFILIILADKKIRIGWIAIPMMFWALILLLKPQNSHTKIFIYLLTGTALFMTIFVEFVRISNDYARMNTVFKFYNQGWILLSISAAFGISLIYDRIQNSNRKILNGIWNIIFSFLVISYFAYTCFASADKIKDRMSDKAPHTLDGMTYMKTSVYYENDKIMDLKQDYEAIQWMQDNIKGSPVIAEGNVPEYQWGNRFTIYTGLPGVIGWNYHQRQQRPSMSDEVWNRVNRVGTFYNSTDQTEVKQFLKDYNVSYIIVGQLEENVYSQEGIQKFEQWNNLLWDKIYTFQNTSIYKVRKEE